MNASSGSFYQSHRCYIVNMNYIMSYNNSRIYMENHLYADIALRKYNDFLIPIQHFYNIALVY
ncbi:MAG: LytTR family transcriptional regulator DNA-binding domain-containing protein [Lachnospira eligens]